MPTASFPYLKTSVSTFRNHSYDILPEASAWGETTLWKASPPPIIQDFTRETYRLRETTLHVLLAVKSKVLPQGASLYLKAIISNTP